MYAITGATGKTGRQVAEILLAKGEKVRAIGRSKNRLQSLVDKGAEAFVADVLDTAAMIKAYTGVKAAYVLVPPDVTATDYRAYYNQVVESVAIAVEKAGVKHVVTLSSIGAHLPKGVGVVGGLYDMEQRFNKLKGVNVLHLRPSFFMENTMMQIQPIKSLGVMASAQKGDIRVPMIATKDIANFAAERLLKLDFAGKSVRELLGPKEVTMNEVAKAIGKAIGKDDLRYVQASYDDTIKALVGMGVSASVAEGYVELSRAFNEGIARPTEKRSKANTTATTLEEFAQKFAAVYQA